MMIITPSISIAQCTQYDATPSASSTNICLGESVTLSPAPAPMPTGYPAGGPTFTVDSDLGVVSVSGENGTSILTALTCAGTLGVEDLTGSQSVQVLPGGSYSLSVDYNTCGGSFGNSGGVYIDFNRDGDFLDAGELVGSTGSISPPQTVGYTINVPVGASFGRTTMRVIQQESGPNPPVPGTSYSWGSVQDFEVIINQTMTWAWTSVPAGFFASGPTAVATPPSAGSIDYVLTGTSTVDTCVVTGSLSVIVNSLPPQPSCSPASRCGIGTVDLSATGSGNALIWYDSLCNPLDTLAAGVNFTTPSIAADAYFLVAEWDSTCAGPKDTCFVTVTTPIAIVATASQLLICDGGGITQIDLLATSANDPNYTYTWTETTGGGINGGFSGSSTTAIPSQTATYTVSGDDGFCASSAQVTVVVSNTPTFALASADTSTCLGDSLKLQVDLSSIPRISIFTDAFESAIDGDPGTLPAGWTRTNTNGNNFDPNWAVDDDTTPSGGTGPNGGHAGGGVVAPAGVSNYIFMETSGGVVGHTAELITPMVNLSGPSAELSFWYYMYGLNISGMDVDISTNGGGTWTNVWSVTGPQQLAGSPWQNAVVDLSAYSGNVMARFVGTNVACCSGDIAVDDVEFSVAADYQYAWTASAGGTLSGDSTFCVWVTPNATGFVTVTVTEENGCTASASYDINVQSIPSEPVCSGDTVVCGPTVASLVGNGSGGDLIWFDAGMNPLDTLADGATFNTPFVTSTDTFYVAEYNGDCFGPKDTCIIEYQEPPVVTATSSDTLVCDGGGITSITLTAASAGSYLYQWTSTAGGGIIGSGSGSVITATPTQSATYTVTASEIGGICAFITSVDVVVSTNPVIGLTAPDTSICVGDSVPASITGNSFVDVANQSATTVLEDFEGFGNGSANQGGWTTPNDGNPDWDSDFNATGSGQGSPLGGHIGGGVSSTTSQYIFFESSSPTTLGSQADITSPVFNTGADYLSEISFWVFMRMNG
ncbi:MAG: GEVED domain-containing protein, partial [Nitrosomonadaceae bacterium]